MSETVYPASAFERWYLYELSKARDIWLEHETDCATYHEDLKTLVSITPIPKTEEEKALLEHLHRIVATMPPIVSRLGNIAR